MSSILFLVILFILFGLIFALVAFLAYRRALRRAKGVERGLKMVPLLIHLPPPTDDEERQTHRDARQLLQEKISQAEVLYDLIAGTAQTGFKSSFYGQRHIAMEIVASGGLIHYFVAVPVAMVAVVEQAILSAYPGSKLEEVEDHNIFNPQGKLTGTSGGELILKHQSAYPISTYKHIERDPMEALLNALSRLQQGDGAAVQIMIRPARGKWTRKGINMVAKKRKQKTGSLSFTPGDLAKAAYKAPSVEHQEDQMYKPSKLEESILEQIEEKTRYPGYETLIRIVASSPTFDRSELLLRNIINAFSLFDSPGMNGFQFYPARDVEGLVTAFIFRFFPPELNSNILNSPELATVFHLPDAQYTPTSQLQRQTSKQVDGPVQTSAEGLLMGYNIYRGTKKEIRLSEQDRRRHTYILGQTGTGKSTMLENLAVQDMLAGRGFAFIDPHGDTAEKLISMVPKERAEDVIYFNPSDMDRPLGLNLFEFSDPTQKDFLINESINMLYKIYDPGKTGIIGPRFEHWFRNAALTLMADPNGASLVEIPKVFTDSAYLKNKFKYLSDPTVIDFWTKEMGQTSDYHKSEMLGWFVSKFGAFMTNDLMRNILGQTKSSFNLREIMDNKKILIVNLSKGKLGDINAQYLGMIFVIKFQAAAMSRANMPEDAREDFCLYVDEFQNYATDSFASILSEARKYRLNLIVANQFIGQLSEDIRDAVFGNVGTMMSYRCGPEDAEFLTKQFAPIFDVRDLVGLPNYSAIMRLMIAGLPSKPFNLSALPPLGVTHQEMGLAVKQLSAAKFGVARQQVEAGIFARLQGKPIPIPASPAPPPTSEPVSAAQAPSVTAVAPATAPAPVLNQSAVVPPPTRLAPAAAPTAIILPSVPAGTPVAPENKPLASVSPSVSVAPQPAPPMANPFPVISAPEVKSPSADIASVVGNVPTSPPPPQSDAVPVIAPPSVVAVPLAAQTPLPVSPSADVPPPPVVSAPVPPQPAVAPAQAPPASNLASALAASPPVATSVTMAEPLPPVRLAGGIQVPLGTGIPSHDQVQSEINELASEAMHVSEERVSEATTPNPSVATPTNSATPAHAPVSVSLPVPAATVVDSQAVPPPDIKPIKSESTIPLPASPTPFVADRSLIPNSPLPITSGKEELKIEGSHELLLAEHANSPVPHTPKAESKFVLPKTAEPLAVGVNPVPSVTEVRPSSNKPVTPVAPEVKPQPPKAANYTEPSVAVLPQKQISASTPNKMEPPKSAEVDRSKDVKPEHTSHKSEQPKHDQPQGHQSLNKPHQPKIEAVKPVEPVPAKSLSAVTAPKEGLSVPKTVGPDMAKPEQEPRQPKPVQVQPIKAPEPAKLASSAVVQPLKAELIQPSTAMQPKQRHVVAPEPATPGAQFAHHHAVVKPLPHKPLHLDVDAETLPEPAKPLPTIIYPTSPTPTDSNFQPPPAAKPINSVVDLSVAPPVKLESIMEKEPSKTPKIETVPEVANAESVQSDPTDASLKVASSTPIPTTIDKNEPPASTPLLTKPLDSSHRGETDGTFLTLVDKPKDESPAATAALLLASKEDTSDTAANEAASNSIVKIMEPPADNEPAEPALQPGEVRVDEDGNVIVG